MSNLKLLPELVSLIHHIELNKSGWWEEAIQRLILASVWLSSRKNLALEEVSKDLKDNFRVNLSEEKVKNQIEALVSSGELMPLPGGEYKIPEIALKKFERGLKEAEANEKQTKEVFIKAVKKHCPSLKAEREWSKFNDQFLLPLIQEVGVNAYQLVAGEKQTIKTVRFEKFLANYPPKIHRAYQSAAELFLDPKNQYVRSYILRSLNAYFLVEASSLKEETLEALGKLTDSKPLFTLFVDTNFLFSILGFHDNPSNEAALLLISLIGKIASKASVKLYVSLSTIAETKKVLTAIKNDLSGVRLTRNLAEAALAVGTSNIPQKFLEDVSRSRSQLDAETYFGPYIKNPASIIRSKNMELFNENLNSYEKRQDVVDDIKQQLDYEGKRWGEKAKRYEQLEHDVVLWHFVNEKRSPEIDSPLQAQYWIVTVDYRFLGFDAFKKSESQDVIPVCLHPTTLIQMLQFWVPRTLEFEKAILSSMRLPLLFPEFDAKTEKVTIRILEVLGRFENVGDLSKETIATILLNDVLRQKMSSEPEVEKQIKLVKEALIEENQKAKRELDKAKEEKKKLKKKITGREETIQDLQKQMKTSEEKFRDAESQIRRGEKRQKTLEKVVDKLKKDLESKTKKEKDKEQIKRFLIRWCVLLFLTVILLGLALSAVISWLLKWPFGQILFPLWSLLLIGWFWFVGFKGTKDSVIKRWKPFVYLHKLRGAIFTLLFGLVIYGIIPNIIWDAIKAKLGILDYASK